MFAFSRVSDGTTDGLGVNTEQARPSRHSVAVSELQRALVTRFADGAIRKLARGQTLWSEGDDREYIYIVRSGCLRLSEMLPDGRRAVLQFALPGDVVGLGADTHDLDAEAVEPTRLDSLSVAQYRRAMADDPAFASAIKTVGRLCLRSARERITVLSRLGGGERIAHFLMEMSEHNRRHGRDRTSIRISMRRVDLADYLGLTPETVCRTLTVFRNGGLISMDRADEVLVKDMERLRSLAGGESEPGDPMRRAS